MNDTVVWIHIDALSPTNPALAAYPSAPALFVFDDQHLSDRKISLKRLMFIYECLLEMPVTIRRGDVAAELLAFMREQGASRIATVESVDPRLKTIYGAIRKGLPHGDRLEIIPVEPFAAVDNSRLDLKRFTRYWSAVKSRALHD